MLRRVEADLVCVWIATAQPCNASLLVFKGADVVASRTPTDDLRALWVSALQPTLQVGAHLHVLAVILDLRAPGGNAVRSGGALTANESYSYDLQLIPAGESAPLNLRDLKLLDDPLPLGYDRGELPGFRTAPEERDKLVIVHGSCRLMFAQPPVVGEPAEQGPFPPPPGIWPGKEPEPDDPEYTAEEYPFPVEEYPVLPKIDGMLWVDALIDQRGPAPRIAARPNQLFLTGDQIYADDVSAVLLPVLNHVGRVLIGDEELGDDVPGAEIKAASLENFPPGFRAAIVHRSAGFTTSDGASHLLSFGEFVAHYILTWSPELWTRDLWPADFNPDTLQVPEDFRFGFLYGDSAVDDLSNTSDYDKVLSWLAENPRPEAGTTPDEHAQWYFDQRRRWMKDRYWSPALFEWWTRSFRAGLPRVRRALANVPTYMLADDHEVTDDWYFSRRWRELVFTRPLGVDIIRHGLMAYSLMQAWGNDPRAWSAGAQLELCSEISRYGTASAAARRAGANPLHELLGLPHTPAPGTTPTFRPLVEYSYQVEGPCHRVLVVDGRTRRRFPTRTSQAGGIDYEGATGLIGESFPTGLPGEQATGLFGDSPMAAALPDRPTADDKLTLVVTGVPVLGPEGMELALVPFQRLGRLLSTVDAEAWSYEPATYEALLAALARYGSVVLLSGDIHVSFTAVADYWSAPEGQPVRTARIVQLISSGLTQDWGRRTPALKGNVLTHDVFEALTTPLQPAERVGWGSPLRQALTPPPPLGSLVTLPAKAVAHPSYRSRLTMQAPVVPTHGWPKNTKEARTPNWAWRAVMVHDERPESTLPPTIERRWTPVELPPDPLAPAAIGWHARAARRMTFGRVFAFQPNVGVVTFERASDDKWSVRHVIAGELPPMADTGVTPTGLQPYVVHRVALAPPPVSSWESTRPRLVDDGGWGVDETEPALQLLLHCLPQIWRAAAKHVGPLWPDLPLNLDAVAREGLITEAADSLSGTFRRRVLRDLGAYANYTQAQLDAITVEEIAALVGQVGNLDVAKEARALVRPDLERLIAFDEQLDDRAALFDDLLLIACSEWVNEHCRPISMIAGILATFRAPVTKHVPVLTGLLEGLWDRWRNHTNADYWMKGASPVALAGLLSLPPRAGRFLIEMLHEGVIGIIQNKSPRRGNVLPIFTPELALGAFGAYFSLRKNNRLTTNSGWEPLVRPPAPGTRLTERTPDTLARQTLSVQLHPGDSPLYVAPAQRVSFTLIPPAGPDEPGHLFAGWDGGARFESEISGGVRVRVEADLGGFLELPWGNDPSSGPKAGTPGAKASVTILRRTRVSPLPGIQIRFTPSVGVAWGFTSDAAGITPAFELRLALNDAEDRIAFVPEDGLLRQLLPTDGITLPIDATVVWDNKLGWHFVGFGELMRALADEPSVTPQGTTPSTTPAPSEKKTEVTTPLNTKLGPLTLHERKLEVDVVGDELGAAINIAATGTVSLNVGPVRVALSGLGVKGSFLISTDFLSFGDLLDSKVDGVLPTGLAVSVDATVISGGGFLQRIESGTGVVTWRGALQLRLTERLDIGAWGIIETGGDRHWSLLVFLIARFTPPYPLGPALKLTAVGGVVAIHRTMDTEALRDAATGTQGNLDALLFPDRPEERFLEIMPALERFFPTAAGHGVAGLMADLEWRADTGTTYGRIRAALLFEVEDCRLALYGTAQLGFPTLANDQILRLRAGIEALYDHQAKFARFSLTLTEALLFKRVHLTGGAALLIRWGDRDEFAFTLGGFHPSFRPFIPEGMREPPRLGAHWKPKALLDLNLQAYLAFTSTTLQFGFYAHLEAGASWGGIRCDGDFDFIVMKEPSWRFEIDLSLRVTAYLFGCDLISAGFRGTLEGANPWYFEGSIYWEVCGVDLSKHLGPYVWGDGDESLGSTTQEARQILGDAFDNPQSWSLRRTARLPVRLRAGSEDAIDPRDLLDLRQSQLPLGTELEVNERNRLSDAGTWTLTPASGGLVKVSDLTDVFPMRRYREKPPKETPFQAGLTCGARFGGVGWNLRRELALVSDEDTTEDLVLDSLPKPPKRERVPVRVLLDDAVLVATPTQATDRRWTRHGLAIQSI